LLGNYVYTPLIWPMLVSALFSVALAVYAGGTHRARRGRLRPPRDGLALWACSRASRWPPLPTKILYHKLEAASASSP